MAIATGAPGTPETSPPAGPGPASQNPTADGGTANDGRQYVTRDEHQAQSAVIGGLRNEIRALTKALDVSKQQRPVTQSDGVASALEEVEKVRAEVRAERDEARRETKEAAIYGALSGQHVDADGLEILFDHVVHKYG